MFNPNSSTHDILGQAIENEQNHGNGFDPTMDSKKIRRIMSNRLSAQRARLRKSKYVTDMEQMVMNLEDMISGLTIELKEHKKKMDLLAMQNQSLQTLLELRLNEARFSEIEVERNKMEVNRLRELQVTLLLEPLITHNNYVNIGSYMNGMNMLEANQNVASTSALKARVLPSTLVPMNILPGEVEAADQYLDLED